MTATPGAGRTVAPLLRVGLGRLLPPGYLRVGPLVSIPPVLDQFGVDTGAILRQVGVSPEVFAHPDNVLPYRTVCRIVWLCTQAVGRDDFGLLAADAISASNLGLVGFLMKQAADVRTAIDDLVRYFHHHDSGAVLLFRMRDDIALLGYAILEPAEPGADQICDGAMAIICNIMRTLCGPKWAPIEIRLSHRAPAMPSRYERHFGVPVRFDAEQSEVVFARSWLDRRIATADAALRDMLEEQIRQMEEMEEMGEGSLVERVRRLIRVALLAEKGSVEHVAEILRMSRRTLERRLEESGSSFRALSDEVHYEVARHLLESTAMPITQIGLALKFSEGSAFTRAFKKWSGSSPRAWRARHRGRDPRASEPEA